MLVSLKSSSGLPPAVAEGGHSISSKLLTYHTEVKELMELTERCHHGCRRAMRALAPERDVLHVPAMDDWHYSMR